MSKSVKTAAKQKKKKYKKGKYPYTVFNCETGALYVRKTVTINKTIKDESTGEEKFVKQRQVWRICEPQTAARAEELLKEIEAEIEFTRSGRARPLSNFERIAEAFERAELVEAQFENGKKIAGRISLVGPRAVVKMLKEKFGHYDIADITYGDLEEFKAERLRTPVVSKNKSRPRSIRTVHYELGFLRQIFNFAYRRRWLDRSPFDDGKNLIDVSLETRRHVNWTRAEERAALAACQGSLLAHMKPVIICITDGGFRSGELLSLKWRDISFETGTMPARSYKGKNLSTRTVYMTDRMRLALIEWKTAQKKIGKITDHSLVIGYKSVKNAWRAIKTKIGREDMHIHDLRHVFATRLALEAKEPISAVSKALGHSSSKTTEIYVNVSEHHVKDSTKKLNELNELFEKTDAAAD